jgi:hypothetical protein
MKTLARTIATLSLASILAALAAPASAQTTGTLTQDGVAMPVKAAVAVLDPKGKEVKIHLLPFVPTAEETAMLQKDNELFLLKKGAHASVTITWTFEPEAIGQMDKAWASFRGHGISKPDAMMSRMFVNGKLKGTFKGELKAGSTISLTSAGTENDDRDKVSWDLNLSAKVLPAVK